MRVGLVTEGGYPFASGEARLWCERLVQGLDQHEFELFALSRTARQHAEGDLGWGHLPAQVSRVRTAALWGDTPHPERRRARAARRERAGDGARGTHRPAREAYGRRERAWFAEHFGDLAVAISAPGFQEGAASEADRFANALYGLAELARAQGGLSVALRSEQALCLLERACHTPGALRGAHHARVADLLIVAARLENWLRPLSLDWYGPADTAAPRPRGGGRPHDGTADRGRVDRRRADRGPADRDPVDRGLAGVDLCHATSSGPAALPGLLAKRFFGTPLLVSEYGVRLREHYLTHPGGPHSAPVRTLLASFHRLLAAEVYAQAALITSGNTHIRRWQERCGADPERLRTVYPGMDADCFAEVGERGEPPLAAGAARPGAPEGGRPSRSTGGPSTRRPITRRSADQAAGQAADQVIGEAHQAIGEADSEAAGGSAGGPAQAPAAASPRRAAGGEARTLLWIGALEPERDVLGLLHAFARIRRGEPGVRLRIVETRRGSVRRSAAHAARSRAYAAQCRALAARLFPDQQASDLAGAPPVSFEELATPSPPAPAPTAPRGARAAAPAPRPHQPPRTGLPELYAAAHVVVLSSLVEGVPAGLIEAMLCGRATVSTDVGAVCEVIGGTGLVVPPRDPGALADACLALLRDPDRRARLGAAARSRALELFTTERNIAAFRDIYLDLMSHCPVRVVEVDEDGEPLPFARPAEAHLPGRWAAGQGRRLPARTPAPAGRAAPDRAPSWAADRAPSWATDRAPGREMGRAPVRAADRAPGRVPGAARSGQHPAPATPKAPPGATAVTPGSEEG